MRIEFLFTPGCEAAGPTLRLLRRVLVEENCRCPVKVRVVTGRDDPARMRFHGSPTILVDGVDIEGFSRASFGYHPSCRVYRPSGDMPGVPAADAIRRALHTHPGKRRAAGAFSAVG